MAVLRTTKTRIAAAITAAAAAAAMTALAVPAQAAPAVGTVVGADAKDAVQGSYIVTLKKTAGLKSASAAGRSVVSEYGGTVKRTYTAALNGYAAELSPAQARRLAADPAVDKVFQDREVHAFATQTNPPSWGLDRIDQAALPLNNSYTYPDTAGEGTTVYVIDTGVRITHQDIAGRASYGYDAVDNDNTAQDGNGHGTHVAANAAGTVYGVAKKAKIVAVRVLNNAGSGTTAQVVAGIDWVTNNHSGPSVANVSLGGGADAALDTAVQNSINSGVTYAIAAGNSGANAQNYSPARVADAITVGATTSTDARASYSNFGARVDLFAPGSAITSAWNTSDTATSSISGTSMATPHVAGAAAVYLAGHPTATPAQVSTALVNGATNGVVTNPGTGSPNKLLRIVP
ncbi:S8 family peptidase [Streptomyces scopuliridis]|uniref:S8 family peptidase n=1 Tax=Streptomyces scopuliridis TaxID=452529 RepID=A0ACD4ZFG6_9ACTN|nr:S8 family peptidase [Streptomyces scopuliridis]WSB32316.1 S8 family peptidase [Streptomyces scopuliridis]WSB96561.1 S8 family peptidase [Streptomyces scopuliridis]WSC09735.1 S8 family peptidase [Streptomyces scopuliridis]